MEEKEEEKVEEKEGEEVEEKEEEEWCHSSTLPFATTSTLLSQLESGTGGLRCPVH